MNIVPNIIEYATDNRDTRNAILYDNWNNIYNTLECSMRNIIIPGGIGQDELTDAINDINVQTIIDTMSEEADDWFRKSMDNQMENLSLEYYSLVFDWLVTHYTCKVTKIGSKISIEFDEGKVVRDFEDEDDAEFIIQRYSKTLIGEIEEGLKNCDSKQLRKIQKIIDA